MEGDEEEEEGEEVEGWPHVEMGAKRKFVTGKREGGGRVVPVGGWEGRMVYWLVSVDWWGDFNLVPYHHPS